MSNFFDNAAFIRAPATKSLLTWTVMHLPCVTLIPVPNQTYCQAPGWNLNLICYASAGGLKLSVAAESPSIESHSNCCRLLSNLYSLRTGNLWRRDFPGGKSNKSNGKHIGVFLNIFKCFFLLYLFKWQSPPPFVNNTQLSVGRKAKQQCQ